MANILKQIFDGWKNLAFPDDKTEEIAKARIEICIDCDYFVKTTKTCNQCGCYMPAKTRSSASSCPKGYWGVM